MRRNEPDYKRAPINTYLERYSAISQDIEIWDYNCGANSFSMALIFVGHRLQEIERLDYGNGDSDCIGAGNREKRQARRNTEEREKEISSQRLQEEAYFQEEKIATGNISLSGLPEGAQVYLDGDHVAYIPCTILKVRAGYHKVVVKSDGYKNSEIIINVEPGRTFSAYIDLIKAPTN